MSIETNEWEQQKKKGLMSEGFHLDPNKAGDAVEKLIGDLGSAEAAFDELMEKLEENPKDTEALRQANLIVNRLDDLASNLRGKMPQINH